MYEILTTPFNSQEVNILIILFLLQDFLKHLVVLHLFHFSLIKLCGFKGRHVPHP